MSLVLFAVHSQLTRIDTVAHVAELLLSFGFLRSAGPKAQPLRSGGQRRHWRLSIGGVLGAELLKLVPARGALGRVARLGSALLGLTGGYSLRWALVYGGREAGADPHLARLATRSKATDPQRQRQSAPEHAWMPSKT